LCGSCMVDGKLIVLQVYSTLKNLDTMTLRCGAQARNEQNVVCSVVR
jgi:hypothetical protein